MAGYRVRDFRPSLGIHDVSGNFRGNLFGRFGKAHRVGGLDLARESDWVFKSFVNHDSPDLGCDCMAMATRAPIRMAGKSWPQTASAMVSARAKGSAGAISLPTVVRVQKLK